jgi:hypothetical protein
VDASRISLILLLPTVTRAEQHPCPTGQNDFTTSLSHHTIPLRMHSQDQQIALGLGRHLLGPRQAQPADLRFGERDTATKVLHSQPPKPGPALATTGRYSSAEACSTSSADSTT